MAYNPFAGPSPVDVKDWYRKMAEGLAAQRNIEAKNAAADDFLRMMNIWDPGHKVLVEAAFEEKQEDSKKKDEVQTIPRWEINDKNEEIRAQNARLVVDGSTRALTRLIYPLYTSEGIYPEHFQQPKSYSELKSLPEARFGAILDAYGIDDSNLSATHVYLQQSHHAAFPNPFNLPERGLPAFPNRAGLAQLFPRGYDAALGPARAGVLGGNVRAAEVRKARLETVLAFLGVTIEAC